MPELFGAFEDLLGFVLLLGVLVAIVILVRSAYRRSGRRAEPYDPSSLPGAPSPTPDEDEVLRRLSAQLDRMERRLDNLETILQDKNGPQKP